MPIQSFYVSWAVAVKEDERVLDNIAKWTRVNTVELTDYEYDWSPQNRDPRPLVFPSDEPFKGLGLHLTTKERFNQLQRFMELTRSKGFDVLCNFAPLYANSEKLAPLACIDITGTAVPGINQLPIYGCPNNPKVLAYGQEMMRETVATWTSANLIAVNHVEFPLWPTSAVRELFSCFCESCAARAKAEGIDFAMIRRDVRTLYNSLACNLTRSSVPQPLSPNDVLNYLIRHPRIGTWLDFRRRSLTEYITGIVKAGREAAREHKRKVRIGLEFAPPTLSYVVGTDFASLCQKFDWISPKFPDYLVGSIIPWVTEQVMKSRTTDQLWLMSAMRNLFDLGDGPSRYKAARSPTEGLIYSNAFNPAMIDNQMKHLRPLIGEVDINPYTWVYNKDLKALKGRLERFQSSGLEGYLIWDWEQDLTEDALKKARGVF